MLDKITVKQEVLALFKRLGILSEKDTGQIVVNINDGAISNIYKNSKVVS